MISPYERVASLLKNVKRNGKSLTARCPAHDDRRNSLSVRETDDGRVLMKCFVDCKVSAIASKIGLTMSDLYPKRRTGGGKPSGQVRNTATVTIAQYAAAKKLSVDFLQGLGLLDIIYWGQHAIRIPYRNGDGSEVSVRIRTALEKGAEADDRFRWGKGSKPLLYGLWRKLSANTVILCEGESDCHTLWFKGFDAIGVPGATTWNEERDAPQFDNVEEIFVVIEPDTGGEAFLACLAKSRIAGRTKLLNLEGYKDPSELYLDHPDDFPERLRKAMRDAIPLSRTLAEKAETAKTAAWERCKHLTQSDDLLARFAQVLIERGVVGEECAAKLLYLVLTTRLLDHPVSAVLKGPSSGGKSFLLDQVLQFFPESAVYRLTAMSERALAYSEADLRNRVLVIFEAVGISGSFASYLVRSLLSEGRIVYEFVEKTPNGMRPRRIEKSGPTSLLVTTTAIRLHPENETRLLSIGVNDSQEQTGAVLLAIARGANESEKVDVGSWVALQEWVQLGKVRAIVPFAAQLARLGCSLRVRILRYEHETRRVLLQRR